MVEVAADDDPTAVGAERHRTNGVVRRRVPRQQSAGGPVEGGQPSPRLAVDGGEVAADVDRRRRDGDCSYATVDGRRNRLQRAGAQVDAGEPAAGMPVHRGEIATEVDGFAVRRRRDAENRVAEPLVRTHRVAFRAGVGRRRVRRSGHRVIEGGRRAGSDVKRGQVRPGLLAGRAGRRARRPDIVEVPAGEKTVDPDRASAQTQMPSVCHVDSGSAVTVAGVPAGGAVSALAGTAAGTASARPADSATAAVRARNFQDTGNHFLLLTSRGLCAYKQMNHGHLTVTASPYGEERLLLNGSATFTR